MIAKKTYYLDKAGNVTTNEEKAHIQICVKGCTIEPHLVKRFGFVDGEIKSPEKNKTKTPEENKTKTPEENKGAI